GNLLQVGLNPAKYAMDHHHEFGDMFEIWVPYLEKIGLQHGLVFNNDYQIWKRNRKLVVQALKSPRFLRQFTKLVQSSFNENESFWDKKEYHFDFAKWIKHFTTDITLRTTTSSPSYCLHAYLFGEEHVDPIKSEEIKKSIKLSHAVQTFFKGVVFGRLVPNMIRHYFPGFYDMDKKYSNNMDWLNETFTDIVKKRKTEIENGDDVGSDLIDVLLTLNTPRDPNGYDEGETPMSDQEVCATLMETNLAGIDTSQNTFCTIMWLLAHHPKVIARFRVEIKEILGDDTSRQITYEDLDKFTYLDAIIKESQRFMPILPLTPRTSVEDGEIGGKYWEPNTIFFILHEQIHKSPENWEDPDQFIPERFLKGSEHKIFKNSFNPFGGGIRICPGKNMALVDLKTVLILLFRKYDIELVDKVSRKPKLVYAGTYHCTEMKVIARPRNYYNM
ncbi:7620_t:CDS:2, partial [Funneliformis caledonium]